MFRERLLDQIRLRPSLFFRVMPLKRRYHELLVNADTQLVIEGYPRCANTYAVAAINTTQPSRLRLARHTHAVAQLLRAYDLQVPTLLLIRNPNDAILSYVIRETAVDLPLAIRRYLDFYEATLPLTSRFVVSDFDTTIGSFEHVIDALNTKFDLTLAPFNNNENTQQAIRTEVESMERIHAGGTVSELKVARPSEKRQAMKTQLAKSLDDHRHEMEQAHALYAEMKAHALNQ